MIRVEYIGVLAKYRTCLGDQIVYLCVVQAKPEIGCNTTYITLLAYIVNCNKIILYIMLVNSTLMREMR